MIVVNSIINPLIIFLTFIKQINKWIYNLKKNSQLEMNVSVFFSPA